MLEATVPPAWPAWPLTKPALLSPPRGGHSQCCLWNGRPSWPTAWGPFPRPSLRQGPLPWWAWAQEARAVLSGPNPGPHCTLVLTPALRPPPPCGSGHAGQLWPLTVLRAGVPKGSVNGCAVGMRSSPGSGWGTCEAGLASRVPWTCRWKGQPSVRRPVCDLSAPSARAFAPGNKQLPLNNPQAAYRWERSIQK